MCLLTPESPHCSQSMCRLTEAKKLWKVVMREVQGAVSGSDADSLLVPHHGPESWTIKKAEAKELMPLNCGVGEDSWESLGLQGDQASQS